MRKIVFISLMMLVAFAACNDDNDVVPSYIGVGTIMEVDDLATDFIVNLDNGTVLTPVNNIANNEIEDGDRVVVQYTIVEEKSEDDLDVNIVDIDDILTKGIYQLTEQNVDSIGNDPLYVGDGDVWLSEKHLNVVYSFYGYNQIHLLNLVKPIGDVTHDDEGRLILEFRHNAHNDQTQLLMNGIVSFEMDDLRVADEDSVNFVVRFNILDTTEDLEFTGTYQFENNNSSALANFKKSKLLKSADSKIQ